MEMDQFQAMDMMESGQGRITIFRLERLEQQGANQNFPSSLFDPHYA